MSDITTLAHVSDLHLPPEHLLSTWRWNVKRLVGLINWQRNRRSLYCSKAAAQIAADIVAMGPDHIAVTGDLANFGLPGEYQNGLDWLATLGPLEQVSLIPGNHDIYTIHCDTACLSAWAHYMQSDAWGQEITAGTGGFPYVRRVGRVAIIALNSAVPTKLFLASGRVGDRQRQALATILDRLRGHDLLRVILIHHPPLPGQAPARRALVDSVALERVLKEHGADLVLHGHNHRDSIRWTGNNGQQIPVVGVATGSVGRLHSHEPLARYNLYRITGGRGQHTIEVITRGLEYAGGRVVELSRRVLTPGATDAPGAFRSVIST